MQSFGFLELLLVLLVSVEIVEDDVQLAIREGNNDALHEAEELEIAPLGMRGDDLPVPISEKYDAPAPLLLKYIYGLSDEGVCERRAHDPYFQHFTGEEFFQHEFLGRTLGTQPSAQAAGQQAGAVAGNRAVASARCRRNFRRTRG